MKPDCGNNASYLECGPNCETTCKTLGEKCTIVFKRCPYGCFCNEGFARDDNNNCIKIDQCKKRAMKCFPV